MCLFSVKFLKELENQRVKEGCKATFVCILNKRNATLSWHKDDLKLRQSSKYSISSQPIGDSEQEHTLIINDMKPDDGAVITAKATLKGYEQEQSTAKLEFSREGKIFSFHSICFFLSTLYMWF